MLSYTGSERAQTVSQEAAYWYVVYTQDGMNMHHSDKRKFIAWMRRSAENISEFYKVATLARKLRMLNLVVRGPRAQQAIAVARVDCLADEDGLVGTGPDSGGALWSFSPYPVEAVGASNEFGACTLQERMTTFTLVVAKWLVVRSARILIDDRSRYEEQWLADLADQRSALEKLLFSMGVLQAGILLRFRQQRLSSRLNVQRGVQICCQDKVLTLATVSNGAARRDQATVTSVNGCKRPRSKPDEKVRRRRGAGWNVAMATAVIPFMAYLVLSALNIDPFRVEKLHDWLDIVTSSDTITTSAESLPKTKRLRDGTAVTLEAGTALHVGFTDARRDVHLLKGKVTFDVMEDGKRPRRPFVVNTHVGRVFAVGTKFAVAVDTAGMEVEVYDGEVEIMRRGKSGSVIKLRGGQPSFRMSADGLIAVAAVGTDGYRVVAPRG